MGHVTESIFSGESVVVPLAEVQHFERDKRTGFEGNITVIMKSTRWNYEYDCWDNPVYLTKNEAEKLSSAWCHYRHELEKDSLADLTS